MKQFIPLVIAAFILFGYQSFAQSNDEMIKKAKAQIEADDHGSALVTVQNAIEASPNNADLFMLKAEINMKLLKLNEAASDYQRAIRLDPQNAEAHLMVGNIFYTQGNEENSSEKIARGCKYFAKAKELGDKRAASMLLKCP